MISSRATYKALLIAAFLLLSQSAVVAHAVDHDLTEHTEWCQLLTSVDFSFAVSDSPQPTEQLLLGETLVTSSASLSLAASYPHYLTRAPPKL